MPETQARTELMSKLLLLTGFQNYWKALIHDMIRKHERTGWPLGSDSFIEKMKRLLDRKLKLKKAGSKNKNKQGIPGIFEIS